MKPIKFLKTKKSNKLKLLVAIFFSVLMVASILGVLVTNNNTLNISNIHNDSSTNIPTGCTSSVSIPTSYYVDNSIANSGTSTVYLPVYENSSEASSDFSYEVGTSGSTTSSDFSIDSSGNLITSYYYFDSTINPTFVLPAITFCGSTVNGGAYYGYTVGTVTVTITSSSGTSSSWSHTFNSENIAYGSSSLANAWVIVTPSISFSDYQSGTFTVSITETNDGDSNFGGTGGTYSYNQGHFITDGSANGNSIVTSEPSQSSTSTMYGWHYGSTSTTLTIPQYETSYDISWSSNAETKSGSPTGLIVIELSVKLPVKVPDEALCESEL